MSVRERTSKTLAYVIRRTQRIHELRVHVGRLQGPGELRRDGPERGGEDLETGRDLRDSKT